MHSAPAVSYPVGRSSIQVLVFLAPGLLGGVVLAAWVMHGGQSASVHGVALLLWLLTSLPVFHALRQTASGMLRWDGQQWTWEAGNHRLAGRTLRRLDWQAVLLLEFRSADGATLWLWPERRTAPLRWDDLRRALQAAPAADPALAGDGAQP
jgi:hypothetical protein